MKHPWKTSFSSHLTFVREKKMRVRAWRQRTWSHSDHRSGFMTSHVIESLARGTDVLNSSRLPSLAASSHLAAQAPPCLFFIDFLPICVRQHAYFAVVSSCLWEKIGFIWASSQVSCDVCLGPDSCVWVCVRAIERRYKKPKLITELRQSEDKQPFSLRLHIQASQSGFYKWHKL